MQPSVDPKEQSQTQFSGQPQIIISDSQFQPKFNFRFLAYAVFVLGVTASYYFAEKSEPGRHVDDYWRSLSEASCCLSIILIFVLYAVFYKGKADWQAATGQSNTWSLTGMIFYILFAGLVVLFGFMWFIGD